MSNWIKDYFQLPENWKLEKLEDLTTLIIDGTHHTPTYTEYGVPFLRVTDVQSKEIDKSRLKFVSQKEHQQLIRRCKPEKGDILYSKNGTIGIPKIVDWDWEFSVFVSLALIKLKKDINPVYVKYLLQSDLIKKQIKRRAKQGTVTNLHLEEIRELQIPRLSKAKETKIAKILTTIDNVIEKTEEAIAKYEAIKQGMMHDLFTRGIGEDGKLRPSFEDAPELYKESALGWIPKEWEVKKLESFAKIFYGKDYKNNPKGGEIPIVGTGGIMGYTSISLNEGASLLTGRKGSINRPKYIDGKFWNVDTVFCIKTNEENNIVKWLYYQFCNIDLNKLNEATGVPSVSSSALNSLKFSVPKKYEQEEIIKRLNSIDNKIDTEKFVLSKQTQLKKGLMQDLLTGKVSVKL